LEMVSTPVGGDCGMRSGFRNRPCTVPVPPQARVRDRAAGRRSKTCVIAWHSESGLPAASKAALRDMALPVLGRWHPCFHSLQVPAVRFLIHAWQILRGHAASAHPIITKLPTPCRKTGMLSAPHTSPLFQRPSPCSFYRFAMASEDATPSGVEVCPLLCGRECCHLHGVPPDHEIHRDE